MSGDERHTKARADLGHTSLLSLKLHPDLYEYVQAKAAVHYCSPSEYVRQLIVDDRGQLIELLRARGYVLVEPESVEQP